MAISSAWRKRSPKACDKRAQTPSSNGCPNWPEEVARKSNFKRDQNAPIASVAELPDYGDHHRRADALREYGGADEELPRSGRRPVGAGQVDRQSRGCVHVIQHAARRTGEHDTHDPCRAPPSRHDHCRIALCRADGHGPTSPAARPTALRPLPARTARARRAPTSSPARAFKAAMSRRSRTSFAATSAR